MAYKMYGAFVASLGVVALMLTADETSARSATVARAGVASRHSISRPFLAHSFRHHRKNNAAIVWPGADDFYGPSSNGEPLVDATQPPSGDVHYTYTYDVPWDWAHRYPPAAAHSDRPYVSGCPAESVTVPGRDGRDQTVNVIRCY
jgi:hypothetical protein